MPPKAKVNSKQINPKRKTVENVYSNNKVLKDTSSDDSIVTDIADSVLPDAKDKARLLDGCPPGLIHLGLASTIFIKPHAGPRNIGNVSKTYSYEILNSSGERIFIITKGYQREQSIKLGEEYLDEEFRKFPFHISVLNYLGEEVFLYYGKGGRVLYTGPWDMPSWGKVTRKWNTFIHCSCKHSGPVTYNIVINDRERHNKGPGEESNGKNGAHIEANYTMDGIKTISCFPEPATKKLYYGTFECDLYEGTEVPKDKEPIGRITSSLLCHNTGEKLPGATFPIHLNVFHKAVIIGVLLMDIVK